MMPVALVINGMAVSLDAAGGTWQIRAAEAVYGLRPWTWGERQRLVAAASQGGRLDREAFLAGSQTGPDRGTSRKVPSKLEDS